MYANLAITWFWKWFEQHNAEYLESCNNAQKLQRLEETLNDQLIDYCEELCCIIYRDGPGHNAVLVITAGADSDYFQDAEELVAKAPVIPGWTILALLPPRTIDFRIKEDCNNPPLNVHRLWFAPPTGPDVYTMASIVVYGNLYEPAWDCKITVAFAIMNLLGERLAATIVHSIQLKHLNTVRPGEKLLHISELPAFIAAGNCSWEVNEKGELQVRQP